MSPYNKTKKSLRKKPSEGEKADDIPSSSSSHSDTRYIDEQTRLSYPHMLFPHLHGNGRINRISYIIEDIKELRKLRKKIHGIESSELLRIHPDTSKTSSTTSSLTSAKGLSARKEKDTPGRRSSNT